MNMEKKMRNIQKARLQHPIKQNSGVVDQIFRHKEQGNEFLQDIIEIQNYTPISSKTDEVAVQGSEADTQGCAEDLVSKDADESTEVIRISDRTNSRKRKATTTN